MKILIDENQVVCYAGNYDFELQPNQTIVKSGGVPYIILSNQNVHNAVVVEVEEEDIPANVVGKYRYADGEFVRNPQFKEATEDSMFTLFQMLDANTPKDMLTVEERIQRQVALLLELAERPNKILNPPADLIAGLKLEGVDITQLQGQDLQNYKIAQNYIGKLRARLKIEVEVGDIYDLLADANKQVHLLTGMLLRLFLLVLENKEIPAEILTGYSQYANSFVGAVDAGLYKDRADIEDPNVMIPKLMANNQKIAGIIETYKNALL